MEVQLCLSICNITWLYISNAGEEDYKTHIFTTTPINLPL